MNKQKRNAYIYATIVALGGFVFGLDAALISGGFKFITSEFNLNEWEVGAIGFGPGLGVLIALPLSAWSSNRYGRKTTLQIIALLYIISAIGSALATSFTTLLAARFLGGLAFSSITLASMYMGEIAPADQRGKLVSMLQINIGIGFSAAYFINYWILQQMSSDAEWVQVIQLNQTGWRWMLGIEIIPAILWFLFLFKIPKSPAWLIYKNRIEEAKKSLLKVYQPEEIESHVLEMKESVAISNTNRSVGSQLSEIFGKPMRVILIIGLTLAIVQQSTGINAIMTYASTMFEQLGLGTDGAFASAIWLGVMGLLATIFSLMLIDRIGRRPLVIGGLCWIIISLGMCAYGFNQATYTITEESVAKMGNIPEAEKLQVLIGKEYTSDIEFKEAIKEVIGVAAARDNSGSLLKESARLNVLLILLGILSFVAAFNFSIGPIMWVLFSEIFPIHLRGIAIPLFALVSSTVSALVQFFFPWQLSNMGASTIFIFYAFIVCIGLIILYKFLPETKNMTLEEIHNKLQKKSSKS
ncbi:MFS transporter [Aquimarina latercula]|uniref:MFS transporter n=1 Tax=Aquimarina latercula TaxID=987 RepID=UPI0004149D2D|nr:MFS transporter [Aquimarina latercula]